MPSRRPARGPALVTVLASVGAVLVAPLVVRATGGCPPGMARVNGAFCVDRYEASLVERLADGTERPWSPYLTPGSHTVRAVSERDTVPQAHIDQTQASQACRAAGRRLCTDREWLSACRGPQRTVFPYGNTREDHRCNENHTRHPSVQLFGHMHVHLWDFAHQNDPRTNQVAGTLARTAAFAGCTNDYGLYDMVGNLHEWTSDSAGTFRGGYYMDTRLNGDGCLYVTTAHSVHYRDFTTGFRCCASVQ